VAELAGISRQIAANRMPAPLSNRAAHGSEYIDESPVKSPTALFALHKMRGISDEITILLVWSRQWSLLWVVSVNRKPEKKTYIGARVHPLGFIREIAVNCEAPPQMFSLRLSKKRTTRRLIT